MSKSTVLESLKVYRDYMNGDDSQVEVVNVPFPVKVEFNAKTIKSLRRKIGTTQAGLANLVGVSPRTVEAWESNRSEPNKSAQKLLTLLMQDKSLADKLQYI
ncbi:helix-turn-helix domain-containing protein [Lactobacillus crispatus]|jgi:predicted transcriptional regulator|uniref:Helix-turn-helix domain-containing protein n=1 Tax=Lactobacillus crispatus TaxID=47770 RepID=A0AAW8WW81_9LACO|nr:helix-turn-helix domain-containing protein [Lactobacillus crispatus]STX18473.1 XRE family transcriptional regulator [Lactobacillus acidophilus]MCT7696400.1 helix-turn-helix domain-containing protein [Lactobacillus crispatus]MCT7707860.1 helix-turn-helix domain-containing protein [Lactobacillus crispatus]MCT7732099.1 helix-turn-helix domain-containing protein [Lactobacillus crispatus]MCT7803321.1 helix-turn-helix domain-containing protein [Lactobacillus crispatus]